MMSMTLIFIESSVIIGVLNPYYNYIFVIYIMKYFKIDQFKVFYQIFKFNIIHSNYNNKNRLNKKKKLKFQFMNSKITILKSLQ